MGIEFSDKRGNQGNRNPGFCTSSSANDELNTPFSDVDTAEIPIEKLAEMSLSISSDRPPCFPLVDKGDEAKRDERRGNYTPSTLSKWWKSVSALGGALLERYVSFTESWALAAATSIKTLVEKTLKKIKGFIGAKKENTKDLSEDDNIITVSGGKETDGIISGKTSRGRYAYKTDRGAGLKYERNQDGVLLMPFGEKTVLLVVDGMGGHGGERGGEVACNGVVSGTAEYLKTHRGATLKDALLKGGRPALERASMQEKLDGIGVTLAGVEIAGDFARFCHLGDSKGIIIRDGKVIFETEERTLPRDQLKEDAEALSDSELEIHGSSLMREYLEREDHNVVTTAMYVDKGIGQGIPETTVFCRGDERRIEEGIKGIIPSSSLRLIDPIRPIAHKRGDENPALLKDGDIIILASDSVWDNIDPTIVAALVKDAKSPFEATKIVREDIRRLVESGIGSDDNFSIIVYFHSRNTTCP